MATKTVEGIITDLTEAVHIFKQKAQRQLDDMQRQLDAVDAKSQRVVSRGEFSMKSIGQAVTDNEAFSLSQKSGFQLRVSVPVGRVFEGKTITETALGGQTAGVVALNRLPGVTEMPMQRLRIRDLIPVRELNAGNGYDFVAQKTRSNAASPQIEGGAKAESTYDWEAKSGSVKTIAHFVTVSRQALDDLPWLRGTIRQRTDVRLEVEGRG